MPTEVKEGKIYEGQNVTTGNYDCDYFRSKERRCSKYDTFKNFQKNVRHIKKKCDNCKQTASMSMGVRRSALFFDHFTEGTWRAKFSPIGVKQEDVKLCQDHGDRFLLSTAVFVQRIYQQMTILCQVLPRQLLEVKVADVNSGPWGKKDDVWIKMGKLQESGK